MRILFLGTVRGNPDEGMKKVLGSVTELLSQEYNYSVRIKSARSLLLQSGEVCRWKPDLIHYLAGPTLPGLVILGVLKRMVGSARTIVSIIHPRLGWPGRLVLSKCGVDVILASSKGSLEWAHRRGLTACFIPHAGVDLDRFHPVDESSKRSLRAELSLPLSSPIVLHVGHIRRDRNIELLGELQRARVAQVVLIGSTTTRTDRDLLPRLEASGCIVRVGFEPNVQEYYQAADVYVFPALSEKGAIQVPLSVLEACAVNLPVVTTQFGGLPDVLPRGDGVHFLDAATGPCVISAVREAIMESRVSTREKVMGLSWADLVGRLARVYETAPVA